MNKATAKASWDERYSTGEPDWEVAPNQSVESRLRGIVPGEAIDLGAGAGRNAVWLASLGWDVIAVDFSSAGLDRAERLAAERGVSIKLVEADATTYRPATPVDLVLISYLQLDPADRLRVLEQAKTWVRPGGTVFVVAHDRSNIGDGYGGPRSADVCYTVEETVEALDGLQIMTAEVVERVVAADDAGQVALDTLVIAHRPSD